MIFLCPHAPRILPPVPKACWREPSQAQPKNCFGHQNQTRFRVRALTHDGVPRWVGWFDDREDADAFLWAIATGCFERPLWDLPVPAWRPDFGEGLLYDFATVVFITTTGTWTSPSDFFGLSGQSGEFIDCIAGGGSGAVRTTSSTGRATGGGAGAWSRITSFSGAPSTGYQVNVGAGGAANGPVTNLQGNNGNHSWFNGTALNSASCSAERGSGGLTSTANIGGSPGGLAANGIGTSKFSGGKAGDCNASVSATGGGGAAGPNGDGVASATQASTGASGGGNGDNGFGGLGTASTTPGGNGTEYDATHGSGGGSGGRSGSGLDTVAAGNYGAASGGSVANLTGPAVTAAAGAPGLVVVSYAAPAAPVSGGTFSMMGVG